MEVDTDFLQKIEEAVIAILEEADHDEATEQSIRATASARLGCDLSSLAHKNLVRNVLETYLLNMPLTENELENLKENENEKEIGKEKEEAINLENVTEPTNSLDFDAKDGQIICKLSKRRGVSMHGARGNSLVSIRDYFPKNGKLVHSYRGISLSADQWSALRKSIPAIEAAITKMEMQIRSEDAAKQNQADTTNLGIPGRLHPEPTHPDIDISNNSMAYPSPRGLVPIQTPRLDGKNYHCWVHLMEFFLKQMGMLYVLTEPCPISHLSPEACSEETLHAKVAAQKWIDDDYICRHSILNSLCDTLFDRYSMKCNSAKELWNELKLAFDCDVGTMRSQVNKYIQFQMVDGVSVIEQVQELHKIANSITASGVWIDENFHISAIVSKLPLSWKEYKLKLMEEQFLPLNMLMHRLRLEEEARGCTKGDKVLMEDRVRAKGDEFSMEARSHAKGEELLMRARPEEEFLMEAHGRSNGDGIPMKTHDPGDEFLMGARHGEPRKESKFEPKSRVWKRPG